MFFKYIDLLLYCVDYKKEDILFINYDVINQELIEIMLNYLNSKGINDIYLDKEDIQKEHELLKEINLNDIENNLFFDDSIWNEFASKNAKFLIFRSPIPNIMEDIEEEKISKSCYIKEKTKSIFNKYKLEYKINWCYAVLPNKIWADKLFNNNINSYQILENTLYKICNNNSIEEWNNFFIKNKQIIEKLNNLKIKEIYYKNSLGTDLKIALSENSIWCDTATKGITNMPSYEIFTSPDFRKTEGIVYNSKPLFYNGKSIDNFYLKFENGKVIEYDAEIGYETLKGIIESDSNSCYLGECAIVENYSPISKLNLNFGVTLLDENASCHLALGRGFYKCFNNFNNYNEEELLDRGLNLSDVHVDFMIGTDDLEIIIKTYDNKIIKIYENGKYILN
ncbi:MAG: aminopeptidase [Lactobacillales bacterium]|nr:aminopeptidase [Lactobacillales bacterium]